MDAAWYEDLRGQLFSLLVTVQDRLGPEQARWVHHVIDVDEYGLALEDIVGILAHAKFPLLIRSGPTCWPWPARCAWTTWRIAYGNAALPAGKPVPPLMEAQPGADNTEWRRRDRSGPRAKDSRASLELTFASEDMTARSR
jgi:hypothetical protein